MSVVGISLAEQVVEYMRFRADGGETTRVLLTGYPQEVLLDACRELVRATRNSSGDLEVSTTRSRLEFRAALMQDPGAGPLEEYEGYPLGSGWDHLVGMRNRGTSLVIAVPPGLLESCPESLKSNTFQDFRLNPSYGAPHLVFGRMASHLVAASPETEISAQSFGYALQSLRDLTKSHHGETGDSRLFAQIPAVSLPSKGERLDLRGLGLLPDRRLDKRLVDGDRDKVAKLVSENLRWQLNLISGLSRWQHKYLADQFGKAERYGQLEAYVAARGMRLEAEDSEWRDAWPLDLYIDDFAATGVSRRPVRIQDLRVDNSIGQVLQVPIVAESPSFKWRLRSNIPELPGKLVLDGAEYLQVDLADQSLLATDALPSGLHELTLRPVDPSIPTKGDYQVRVLVPDESVQLLATVDSSPAGADVYEVPEKTELDIRWQSVPGAEQPDFVELCLESSTSSLKDDVDDVHYLLADGVDEDTEVVLQGVVGSERPPSMRVRFTIKARSQTVETRVGETTSVARGLLSAVSELHEPASDLGELSWETTSQPTKLEVRVWPDGGDPDAYEPHELEYRYCVFLRQFEKQILDHPQAVWPRLLLSRREGGSRTWYLSEFDAQLTSRWAAELDSELWNEFLRARQDVFKLISANEALIAGTDLWTNEPAVRRYLCSYLELVRPLAQPERPATDELVALALIDAVLLPRGSTGGGEPLLPSSETSADAILMAPTHPLRLAWLCGYEGLVKDLLGRIEAWSVETISSLDSLAYPGTVVDFSMEHFHATGVLDGDRWSLLLPEFVENPDSVIPSDLARQLDLSMRSTSTGAGAKEIAREISHYQDLHPFKASLRIGFANPGSGEGLREALSMLISGHKEVRRSNALAEQNSRRARYLAEMIATDGEPRNLGVAFDEYAASDDADDTFLERVVFSRTDEGLIEPDPADKTPRHHLLFGAGVARLVGQNVSLSAHAAPVTANSLLLRQRRSFESDSRPETLTHTLVNEPGVSGDPGEMDLPVLTHWTAFLMQCVAAATRESRFVTWTTGRAVAASVAETAARQIDAMHGMSEWVCMIDSQIDVEYFDDPSSGDRYVIEYVPRFAARTASTSGSSPSAFVVTSDRKHNTPITSAINRFLTSAYGQDLDEKAAIRLASAVNRVSGLLLLTLAGQPSAAKGAAGMGLVHLLYESTGLLGTPPNDPGVFRMLLPIDDYASYWTQAYRGLKGPSVTGDHADLLDIELRYAVGRLNIVFQVLEVKNHKLGHYPQSLHQSAASQVLASVRMLEALFGVGTGSRRADATVQDWELSELLDFHMRRSARQQYGSDPVAMRAAADFRRLVRGLVAQGDYSANWRSSDHELAGIVLHFNPNEQRIAPDASRARYSQETKVGYIPFGLDDICDLLNSRIAEWAGVCASILTEWPAAPASGEEPNTAGAQDVKPNEGGEAAPVTEVRARAIGAFDGFVGNAGAVTSLTRYVAEGLMQEPHRLRVNLALIGPASTGKTTLSRRIAQALGLPFVDTQGQALASLDDLVEKMQAVVRDEGGRIAQVGERMGLPVLRLPPMVVFIDEAHELKPKLREAVLTLLEESDRTATTSRAVVEAKEVTFILATTEWGEFPTTLQSRCRAIKLQAYSLGEVAQMIGNAYPQFSEEVDQKLAIAARLTPRVALAKASELEMACRVDAVDDPALMLETLFAEWGIDDDGISELDLHYLAALEQAGGRVGVERLQTLLATSEKELKRNVEPYLIHKGLIQISGNGREITGQGSFYVARSRRGTWGS